MSYKCRTRDGINLASFVIAMAAALHAVPGLAQQIDCGREKGLKAIGGQAPAVLSFHNPSAQPRRLYWIDFQGQRKAYGIIAPGGDRKQSSSVGNHWVVTDEANQCVALFTVSTAANAFVIAPLPAASTAAPAPAVAAGLGITPAGFDSLFPAAGGAAGMPTSTMVSTADGPVMVMAFVPPAAGAGDPAQPTITRDALNALLFAPGDGCGAPMRLTVQSPLGPRLVSAVRPPRPGRCGFPAAQSPTPTQGAPSGGAGTTTK